MTICISYQLGRGDLDEVLSCQFPSSYNPKMSEAKDNDLIWKTDSLESAVIRSWQVLQPFAGSIQPYAEEIAVYHPPPSTNDACRRATTGAWKRRWIGMKRSPILAGERAKMQVFSMRSMASGAALHCALAWYDHGTGFTMKCHEVP